MNRLIGMLLLIVIIASASLGISLLNAQTTSALQISAEWKQTHDVIGMAITSMATANRSLTFAVKHQLNTTVIAGAQHTYQEGIETISAANASLYTIPPTSSNAQSTHTSTRQLALNAMHLFKTTIQQLNSLWTDLNVFNAYRTLEDTIRRLETYRTWVLSLLSTAKTAFPQYNYTDIDHKLHQVEIHLAWAKQNVTAFLLDTARHEVEYANRTMNTITAQIQHVAAALDVKRERIIQFINGSLTNLKRAFLNLASEIGQDVTNEEIQVAMTVETAKQRLAMGNIEGAIAAVWDAYRLLIQYTAQLSTQTLP
jgi:hypothetical protein